MSNNETKSMEAIVSLCKRRGFIYPASEIYGGLNGFWDFGPLGVQLKNNLRDAWWRDNVTSPPIGPDGTELSIVGIDTSIIQNPRVWEASGHIDGFSDPMVDCRESKSRYRADHIMVLFPKESKPRDPLFAFIEGDDESRTKAEKRFAKWAKQDLPLEESQVGLLALTDIDASQYGDVIGPEAKEKGTLTQPREFNLMFQTHVGAVRNEDAQAYLRPETAQGIFINYKNVLDTMRVKLPFGIAQIGKAFRNEVTPRNFIFRSREFEQMEIEWFCHPDEVKKWYEFWCDNRKNWWQSLGLTSDNVLMRAHDKDELAHYAKEGCGTFDVEYRFPFTAPGYGELEGIAHRGDYDLRRHQEFSRTKLEYFIPETKERFLPHVIEPSAGLSRGVLALICEAFTPDPNRPSKVYLKFHPKMAPIQAAVFPLVNKEGMPEVARKIYEDLRRHYAVTIDIKQSIGKRYARMDEAGTPFCFTVDGQTLEDQTITVRERDTLEQHRISITQAGSFLAERIYGKNAQ